MSSLSLDLNQKMMNQFLNRYEYLTNALSGTDDLMEETYRNELLAERRDLEVKIAEVAEKIFKHSGFNSLSDKWRRKIWMWHGYSEDGSIAHRRFTSAGKQLEYFIDEDPYDAVPSIKKIIIILEKGIAGLELNESERNAIENLRAADEEQWNIVEDVLQIESVVEKLPLSHLKEMAQFFVDGYFSRHGKGYLGQQVYKALFKHLESQSFLEKDVQGALETAALAFSLRPGNWKDVPRMEKPVMIEYALNLPNPNVGTLRACLDAIVNFPLDVVQRQQFLTRLFEKAKQEPIDITKRESIERIQIMMRIIAEMAPADRILPFRQLFNLFTRCPLPHEMTELAQSLPDSEKPAAFFNIAIRSAHGGQDFYLFLDSIRHYLGRLQWFSWESGLMETYLREEDGHPKTEPLVNRQSTSDLLGLPIEIVENIASGLSMPERARLREAHSHFHGMQKQVAVNEYLAKKAEIKECAQFLKRALSGHPESFELDFDALLTSATLRPDQVAWDKEMTEVGRMMMELSPVELPKMMSDFSRLHFPFMRPVFAAILDKLLARVIFFLKAMYNRGNGNSYLIRAMHATFFISDKKLQLDLIKETLTFRPEIELSLEFTELIHEIARLAPAHLTLPILEYFHAQVEARDRFLQNQYQQTLDQMLQVFQNLAPIFEAFPEEQANIVAGLRDQMQAMFQNNPPVLRNGIEIERLDLMLQHVSDLPIALRNVILNCIFDRLCHVLQDGPGSAEERAFVQRVVQAITEDPEHQAELYARIGLER